MTRKWRKQISTLVVSSVILALLPFGGAAAAPSSTSDQSSDVVTLGQSVQSSSAVASASTQSGTTENTTSEVEQRVIITFKDKKKMDKSIVKGKIKREQKHSPSLSARMTSKEIEKLKKNAAVQSVEPDIQLQATAQTIDWGVNVVNATYAWNNGYTGKGVKVAILDSGISTHHEDLSVTGGASFVDYTTSYEDDAGHGTHVAGIIGAKNNDIGVVGVAPDADLYALKVLDATGKGYLSDVIAGIDWAIDNKMDIINMSMATSVDSPALHNAVDQAYAKGLLVVAAAGNAGNAEGTGDTIQYPAKYSSVISVGAVDQNEQRVSWSATGNELELVAPGVGIKSTYLNNDYTTLSGTSMAAAFVTGELALLKQLNATETNTKLRNLLDEHVSDLGESGKDSIYGYGSLNSSSTSPTDLSNHPEPSVTGDVYKSVYGNIYATATGPSVIVRENISYSWYTNDATANFPSLTNAKSIATSDDGHKFYVLYNDNTVKVRENISYSWYTNDATANFPSLTNAKSITVSNNQLKFYVLYNDNTVKVRENISYSWYTNDATANFPSLTNAKSIATSDDGGKFYVLNNDNTVKVRENISYSWYINDATANFPSLTNAKSITLSNNQYKFYTAYLNFSPILNAASSSQMAYKSGASSTITLTGTISDSDNDNVTISATIAGVTKSITISNTLTTQPWTLQWNVVSDNIPVGSYSNISVTANDGLWGNASSTYTGTIIVDNVPNAPSSLNPGNSTASTPTLVPGTTPVVNWLFSDPDVGDIQSAYDVQIYNAAGTTLLSDSGWVSSSTSSYTIPSGVLSRGTTYGWRVAVKDNKGGASSFSSLYYVKPNILPTLTLTSYADGQQVNDNILTFTWTYADADGQVQTSYRVQGSKDNWATVGYDSGIVSGSAVTHMTSAIPDGTWNFRVTVNDGMEWSTAVQRTGLIVPNAYEPNDTSAQAFAINYNIAYTSLINTATDVDFFKYVAPATGIDRITLTMPADKNYDVYIYDSNMNFVAASVANGAGIAENAIYQVTGGATYYVKIVGVNGNYSASNPYTLKVSKFTLNYNTGYQFDANGNMTSKQTNSN
ncbi:S8 family peptidase [Paenibacillus alba]|uniref:S8 family peptidase n=1 Tax=Paenibacillus alba TaxID=1197127 RepID=A0ABU6GBJ4_9BACL|nr:S8 family peptidase [Paenibacillus alba]MEC0230637.1 S8 family peptidase [Paenibacillus alba]